MGTLETPCPYVPRPKGEFRPFIYYLADPLEPKHVRYVGMAGCRADRPYYHAKLAKRSKKNSHLFNWIRGMQAAGREPAVFVLEELPEGASHLFVGEIEKMYISSLGRIGHDLTNVVEGGGGSIGYRFTPEAVAARAAKIRGRKHPHSEETRALLSALNKGKPSYVRTPETRKKNGDANLGRVRSAESRELNRVAHLGVVNSAASIELQRQTVLNHTPEQRAERVARYRATCDAKRAADALLTPHERAQKKVDKLNAKIAKLKARVEKDNA